MRPQDQNKPAVSIPPRQTVVNPGVRSTQANAAADLARGQIDRIYSSDPNLTTEQADEPAQPTAETAAVTESEPATAAEYGQQAGPGAVDMNKLAESSNPYERSHDETKHEVQDSNWQKYHSAWQSYYQQYYERYYLSQVHQTKKSLEDQAAIYKDTPRPREEFSTDEAMYDLRSQLRGKMVASAQKVRKSRHFIPVAAAVVVMLGFALLQYNRVLISYVQAYVSPGAVDPSTLIVDPNAALAVSAEPLLIIPKINVNVPMNFDANAASQDSLNKAMDNGVAWFNIKGASARPGEVGNFVLSGHSSNDWLDGGNYKFIFARLEQLTVGDTIYVNYNSVRYTYTVTKTQVVKPTDVSALTAPTTKPEITLVTCTPLGTALNRLLVFGEQVSPDPSAATAAVESDDSSADAALPSNSPTFLERIFGGSN